MKKYINKKYLYIILILLWLSIIFISSSMTSNSSNSSSKAIISKTVEIGYSIIGKDLSINELNDITNRLNYPFRKCMHASVYFILSIFIINVFKEVKMENWKKYTCTILLCFLWAILDELHQVGVDGRTGQMLDVWIDTFGSIFGLFIFLLYKRWEEKKLIKKN